MDKNSSTDSNISLDSLESHVQRKPALNVNSDENVDTILVPFYEKDVLIKVPKDKNRKQNNSGNKQVSEKLKKELFQSTGYLVNKERDRKPKQTTYLEMFRKQFAPNHVEQKKDRNEIRSISPEFGDTERESIGEEANNPVPGFYDTEPYNEMYYEKLLCRDIQRYLDNSYEEDREEELHLEFTEKVTREPVEIRDPSPENFRSVSEVTNHRRHTRRATVEPIQTVRLGGLGPDIEQIKPRLERARSLQRYSEKVRMENRLKIYKKTCQTQVDKKVERVPSVRSREPVKEPSNKDSKDEERPSYLVNKSNKEKEKAVRSAYNPYFKSKSAGTQRTKEKPVEKDRQRSATKKKDMVNQKMEQKPKVETKPDMKLQMKKPKERTKSGSINKGINTDAETEVPPVQISFMVNVGGVRQTSALKTLEEKHRMYQEQVKAFMENNSRM